VGGSIHSSLSTRSVQLLSGSVLYKQTSHFAFVAWFLKILSTTERPYLIPEDGKMGGVAKKNETPHISTFEESRGMKCDTWSTTPSLNNP
jgi:hypothetical protein